MADVFYIQIDSFNKCSVVSTPEANIPSLVLGTYLIRPTTTKCYTFKEEKQALDFLIKNIKYDNILLGSLPVEYLPIVEAVKQKMLYSGG